MSLNITPVTIRGKRKTPAPPTSNIPTALQLQEEHRQEQERERQQSLGDEPPDRFLLSRAQTKRSIKEVMAAHSMQGRPALDSLPSEILEKILLQSCSLALPRASPVIGAKLSEKATLVRFFIWTFHETWDQWYGIPTSKALHQGPPIFGGKRKRIGGDPVQQSAVLRLPWVTMDIILTAQQTWADNHAEGRSFQHAVPWSDDENDIPHSHKGGISHFNAKECFEVDYQQALKWTPFLVDSMPWGYQDVHPQARIPPHIITGPWDDERLRQMFWMVRGGMMPTQGFDDLQAPPWEDKLEFLRNVVLNVTQPKMLAINCLMGVWIFQGLPTEVVRDELNNIDRRLMWGDDSDEMRDMLQKSRTALNLFLDYKAARRSSV